MSIINSAQVACTHCGAQDRIKVYHSINVSENPELKAGVLDGSLFVWQCPACKQANLARYETLYHDPDAKLMVWLLPSGDMPESQMTAITNHTRAMGGYTLRRVPDVGTLMEKVKIFEAGLDDMVVEMCKYVTRMELAAKVPDRADEMAALQMKFFKMEEQGDTRFITLMFPDNGQMSGLNIGFNVYEDCAGIIQRNPSVRAGEGFLKIDSDWLQALMA